MTAPERLRRVFRRTLKWGAGLVILLLTMLILGTLAIAYFVPADVFKDYIVGLASETLQRQVTAGPARFHILRGFSLSDVVIHENVPPDAPDDYPEKLLEVGKVQFSYRPFPLFRRQLLIDEVRLDEPRLWIYSSEEKRFNFDDLLALAGEDTAAGEAGELPIRIDLERISISRGAMQVAQHRDFGVLHLRLGGLEGAVHDLSVPRAGLDSVRSMVRGHGELTVGDGRVDLRFTSRDSMPVSRSVIPLRAAVEFAIFGLDSIPGHIGLDVPAVDLYLLSDSTKAWRLNAPSNLKANFLAGGIDGDTLFRDGILSLLDVLPGRFHGHVDAQGNSDFQVTANLSLPDVLDLWRRTLPDSIEIPARRVTGSIPLDLGIHTIAALQDTGRMIYDVTASAESLRVEGADDLFELNGVGFSFDGRFATKMAAPSDSLQYRGVGQVTVRQGQVAPDDTTVFEFAAGGMIYEVVGHRAWFHHLEAHGGVGDFEGMTATFNSETRFDAAFLPARGSGSIEVEHIDLAPWTKDAWRGTGTLTGGWKQDRGLRWRVDQNLVMTGLMYSPVEGEPLPLPDINVRAGADVRADSAFVNFDVENIQVSLPPFGHARGTARIGRGDELEFDVNVDSLGIAINELGVLIPYDIQDEYGEIELSGMALGNARVEGSLGDTLTANLTAGLEVADLDVNVPEMDVFVRNIWAEGSVAGTPDSLAGSVALGLDTLRSPQNAAFPIVRPRVDLPFTLAGKRNFSMTRGTYSLPGAGLSGSIAAASDLRADTLVYEVGLTGAIGHPQDTLRITPEMWLTGTGIFHCAMDAEGSIMRLNGSAGFDDLSLGWPGVFAVSGINGRIEFGQAINLETAAPLVPEHQQKPLDNTRRIRYTTLWPYYFSPNTGVSSISIDWMEALTYRVEDVRFQVLVEQGLLALPDYFMRLYGGTLAGDLWVDFSTPEPRSISYATYGQLARLNSAQLPRAELRTAEESEIDGTLDLRGTGIDPEGPIEVEGALHITRIGAQATDNLLRALDPQEVDQGIQDTRNKLKAGIKPKLISCEIKHGYLYPVIHVSQPWWHPVRISGGKIGLSRIPFKIFMTTPTEESG